jgi:lipopolysaccharide transport system ATP-binding protein
MRKPAIRAENLGKAYRIRSNAERTWRRFVTRPPQDLFWALRGVAFEVQPGEVVGVIGRNGAGKSTLLKILSRVTEPTEGRIEICGRVGSLLEVGTGFHPELSGRQNVYLNATIMGMSRNEIDRKFDEIIHFAEIDERFLDMPLKRYSSGMHARLAFAVAAHLDPDVLIVDEVLAVGDLQFQKKCLGRMSQVAGEGRTVLFVSHQMPAVKSLCRRAILLDHGQLEATGNVEEVVAQYVRGDVRPANDGLISDGASRLVQSAKARLRQVSLRDRAGQSIRQVFLGQAIQIALVYEIASPLTHAAIELGISTLEGLRVATVCSLDEEVLPLNLQSGLYEIVVQIEVTLLPGTYTVDAFIQDLEKNTTLDWVERTLQFSAADVSETGLDRYHWNQVRGFVRPKSLWMEPCAVKS